MTRRAPISDEELHAYLDGELEDERRRAVEAYLGTHPEEARRLDAYRADGEAIARIFSAVGTTLPKRRRRIASWWKAAAAAMLIFLAGAATGWLLKHNPGDTELRRLGDQAAVAHLLLSTPGSQDLKSASPADLTKALVQVLGRPVDVRNVDATGFTLLDARVLPSPNGRSVQLAFRGREGETITFYLEARPGATETPFTRLERNGLTTVVWEDDDLACAVSGYLPAGRLEAVAHQLYETLIS